MTDTVTAIDPSGWQMVATVAQVQLAWRATLHPTLHPSLHPTLQPTLHLTLYPTLQQALRTLPPSLHTPHAA